MNPENQYPELKTLQKGEIFIEWIYIVNHKMEVTKILSKTIIPKKERNNFVADLESKVSAWFVNLAIIEKE